MTLKKISYITLILLIVTAVLMGISHWVIQNNANGKTSYSTKNIQKNKVGLLLGTSKYVAQGKINLYYQYRIDAAVNLFKSGKIDYILVSGDNASMSYNEPQRFKKDLVARGIPDNKIILDYAGFRTLDSVVRAKEIFGQEEVTVVSQKFHNERAIYIAEKKGIKAIGYNAQDVPLKNSFKISIREYAARTKVFLDLLFQKQPKFLGEKIEIN